jgi:hypothetical protein
VGEQKKASFLYSLKAVAWSFFGLRRKSDFDQDEARLHPLHILAAALIGVACFIGLLVAIIKWVVL